MCIIDKRAYLTGNSLGKMMKIARDLKVNKGVDPFMTLSFLALAVITDVKITDKGLLGVVKIKTIDINRG